MKIILHDPVIVSQAPAALRGWGPWQFPLLLPLPDGRLLLEFHQEADSATAYGLPVAQRVSADGGASWEEVIAPGIRAGLRLPNGDELRATQELSIPAGRLALPNPVAFVPSSHPLSYTYYRWSDLPTQSQSGWGFLRKAAGSPDWTPEHARVEFPNQLACVSEGVLVLPFFEQDRIQVAPDGRLVATLYAHPHIAGGRFLVRRYLARLVESLDGGRTWSLKSAIPYRPDMQADPFWDERDGFSEPQIVFLPDGSVLAFLRTDDGNGAGPLYWTRSQDGGQTWEQPAVFDRLGVWPQARVLANGAILVSYGRPGLFLRAALDPAGRRWGAKKTLVEPGPRGQDTCSYSSLLALPEGGALIAYSDFHVPGPDGTPRKTILVRKIEVR